MIAKGLLRRALLRTTAFRMAAFYTLAFIGVILAGLAYTYWATVGEIDRRNRALIEEEAADLAERFRAGGMARLVVSIEDRVGPGVRTDGIYLLMSPSREALAGNLTAWPAAANQGGFFSFNVSRQVGGQRFGRTIDARAFALPGGFRLLVGRESDQRERFRVNFLRAAVWVAGATLLIGGAVGIYASRRVLRRVELAARAGERIAGGNLETRLPLAGTGDEFDRLAGSLNSTLDRISALMGGMRLATDAISHDVRRPLTRLRAKLELAMRDSANDPQEAMGVAMEEIDKTVLILNNLLKIARAEAGVAGSGARAVDLASMAAEAVELYDVVAEEVDVRLDSALAPAPAIVEPQLTAQAIANLIDNAIKYVGAGGKIRVETGAEADGRVFLRVSDNGKGIPPELRDRAMERFVRLDDDGSRATEGSGLGLSLVRAVAHMNGGQFELGDANPGLIATIYLPQSTE